MRSNSSFVSIKSPLVPRDAPDFSLSIKGKPSKAPGEGPAAPPLGCQIYCDAGSCKVKSCGMISGDPIVHAILISSTGKNVIIRRAHPSAVLLFLLWLDLLTNPQNQKQHIPHLSRLFYQCAQDRRGCH